MSAEDYEQMAQEQLAKAEELQRRLTSIVGDWTSPDRSVSLKVGPGGVLFALRIREHAMTMGGDQLGSLILDGVQAAGQQAGDQARQAVSETVGDLVNFEDLIPPTPLRTDRASNDWLGDAGGPRTSLD